MQIESETVRDFLKNKMDASKDELMIEAFHEVDEYIKVLEIFARKKAKRKADRERPRK